MATKVTIDKNKKVMIIELDIVSPAQASSTGKTMIVATTRGNKETEAKVDGQPIYIGVNAYYYATPKAEKE